MSPSRGRPSQRARPLPDRAVVRQVPASDDGVLCRLIPQRTFTPPVTDEEEELEMSATYTVVPVTPMQPRCMGAVEQLLVRSGRTERAPKSLLARVLAGIRSPEEAARDDANRPAPLQSGFHALLGRR